MGRLREASRWEGSEARREEGGRRSREEAGREGTRAMEGGRMDA
jgi:hypothetical protein